MDEHPTIAFRVAGEADIAALVALIDSAYRGEESEKGWTTEAHLLGGRRTDDEAVAAVIGGPGSSMLVADVAGELVGCCQLDLSDGRSGYFGMFSVRPGLQGRGLGRAVLGEAERRAAAAGARRMRMTVIRQRHDLIAWYGRLGYERTGVTSPFPYGDERFGRPKVGDLEFAELAKGLAPVTSRTTEGTGGT